MRSLQQEMYEEILGERDAWQREIFAEKIHAGVLKKVILGEKMLVERRVRRKRCLKKDMFGEKDACRSN